MQLYEALSERVTEWSKRAYPHAEYSTISEILSWAANPDGEGFQLRTPQLRALETYWYLRLVEGTPRVFDLYNRLFEDDKSNLLGALGVPDEAFKQSNFELQTLWEKIKNEDKFAREFKLNALRETLTLKYPSYILALAMGTGKTVLIGAIFATEFAMAMEYDGGPFVQNALVFAPGLTIIESLRELIATRYERILPPRLYKAFAASAKFTFTRDGEKNISVVPKSYYNIVVTNTEKIRIQKESIRKIDIGSWFAPEREEEAKGEVANLRLQTIASLPHLAVFSDEAHHTYGQSLGSDLKKVRKTVDYLAANTNVVCALNTTGTPFFQRQPLRDVVIWYGLSRGINDGILKEVDKIQGFDFSGDTASYLTFVIEDFFKDYGAVALPDGTPSKLAIYFPRTDDVEEFRPVIEAKLLEMNLSPAVILEHHTKKDNKPDFDRFKTKDSPHRIALLVDRGVEGWDVPALFGCALARRLRTSNNFVLQAASRCLRQTPGNLSKARIYLSIENEAILANQLRETYNETIDDLRRAHSNRIRTKIRVRKLTIPELVVRQIVRTVIPKPTKPAPLELSRPEVGTRQTGRITTYKIGAQKATTSVLQQVGDSIEVETLPQTISLYEAAVELATVYRLDLWEVYDALTRVYDGAIEISLEHMDEMARQIEALRCDYETSEEVVERALALVKPGGFERELDANGGVVYTAEISFPVSREHLLLSWEQMLEKNPKDFGFHYSPYNFDSNPEKSFFEILLQHLYLHRADIEDIYFTGALTTPNKTDFYVDYKGEDDRWHRYTPDFIIRRKDGRCLIVEIKSAQFQNQTEEDLRRDERGEAAISVEGRKAVALKRWTNLSPEQLSYEVVFARENILGYDQTKDAREFVVGKKSGSEPPQIRVEVPKSKITSFCRKWKISELAFFGSVLREDFRPDSDIDVLVTFALDARWSVLDLSRMQDELTSLLGRNVDLVDVKGLRNPFRKREILSSKAIVYAS